MITEKGVLLIGDIAFFFFLYKYVNKSCSNILFFYFFQIPFRFMPAYENNITSKMKKRKLNTLNLAIDDFECKCIEFKGF